MSESITFTLDGKSVSADPEETIWQVAKRLDIDIPHLCWSTAATYRADGNCRACMVEIEGERVLAASCIRKPSNGMTVTTDSPRTVSARKMVMELLLADQPPRKSTHDPQSHFWHWAEKQDQIGSRFQSGKTPDADLSHPAMAVNLDACIHCNLCVRACRESQVNDVIGLAYRGRESKIVFDFDDPMGNSTCVACGECVQACPTGALMPAVDSKSSAMDRQVHSVCPYCGVGCQITYNIKNDRIHHVDGREGPANAGRLCVKGRYGFDYVSHPGRLTVPLIRKDGEAKSSSVSIDPSQSLACFREASWEEALDAAGNGLKAIRDQHGGDSLAGFGSAKGSNEEAYLFQKLVRTGFGTNNVDHCTRLCHASSVAALMETIGSGAVTAPFTDAVNSDVILVTGANPTENHPVAATFLKNAAKTGAKLIVMDPRGQALRKHATHMLQFNAGSDVALLNAVMNVIIADDLVDHNYIKAHTEDYEKIRDHLKSFTPEAMAPICGISPEKIHEVAHVFGTAKAAMIFWGMGISQHVHGTDNARCLISLALMTGQVGRPGSGLHPLRGQNNVQGASDAGLIPMVFPDYQSVEDKSIRTWFENYWNSELDPKRGLTVVEITEAIHNGTIRGVYIMGENPAMSDPDVSHAREALAKLEHLVVQDIFLTETAQFADVILPASAWPEKDGTVTNTNRQVQMGRKALSLPGSAQQDWWIINEMANRLGLNWQYSGPAEIYEEMRGCMDSIKGISWDRLQLESAVTYPCADEDQPGDEIIFGEGYPTTSGRGKFVPAGIVPPDEQPDDEYPMVLTTGRMLEHWHTGAITRRASILNTLEPEAVASLSTQDLRRLAMEPGDWLTIRTRRGEINIKARADNAVSPGMVFVPFAFVEASANLLTNAALDPFGKIPEFKYCAAQIEKAFPPPQSTAE